VDSGRCDEMTEVGPPSGRVLFSANREAVIKRIIDIGDVAIITFVQTLDSLIGLQDLSTFLHRTPQGAKDLIYGDSRVDMHCRLRTRIA
jgi:hypothetical protein